MTQAPVLSVIVPAFNVECHLCKTLQSLIAQKDLSLEIVVVNDGSTDSTEEIAYGLLGDAGRVISTPNAGVSAARNTGLAAATGLYVLFLDGDDFVAPTLTAHLAPLLLPEAHDVILWRYKSVILDEQVDQSLSATTVPDSMPGIDALTSIVFENRSVWTGCTAYRRAFLVEHDLSFTPGCSAGEDREFIYKALAHAKAALATPQVLSYYVNRTASLSQGCSMRHFATFAAHERAREHILALEDPRYAEVAVAIVRHKGLANFFRYLYRCAAQAAREDRRDLFTEIQRIYPGLFQRVRREIARRFLAEHGCPPLMLAFAFSPHLFRLLVSLSHRKHRFHPAQEAEEAN